LNLSITNFSKRFSTHSGEIENASLEESNNPLQVNIGQWIIKLYKTVHIIVLLAVSSGRVKCIW
jgi:hypothetical protein